MKFKKNIFRIAFIVCIMMITLLSCDGNNREDQNITLSYKNSDEFINIEYAATGSEEYDDIYIFQSAMDEIDDIPYVDIGTKIIINFDRIPTEYKLTDSILKSDGSVLWGNKGLLDLDVNNENDTYSFLLDTNVLLYLSSDSTYLNSDRIYRGLRLACSWEDDYKVFYYIIETDAR